MAGHTSTVYWHLLAGPVCRDSDEGIPCRYGQSILYLLFFLLSCCFFQSILIHFYCVYIFPFFGGSHLSFPFFHVIMEVAVFPEIGEALCFLESPWLPPPSFTSNTWQHYFFPWSWVALQSGVGVPGVHFPPYAFHCQAHKRNTSSGVVCLPPHIIYRQPAGCAAGIRCDTGTRCDIFSCHSIVSGVHPEYQTLWVEEGRLAQGLDILLSSSWGIWVASGWSYHIVYHLRGGCDGKETHRFIWGDILEACSVCPF